jgi:hypothetical protein
MQPMKWVYGVNEDIAGAVRTGSKHRAEFRLGLAAVIICYGRRTQAPGA